MDSKSSHYTDLVNETGVQSQPQEHSVEEKPSSTVKNSRESNSNWLAVVAVAIAVLAIILAIVAVIESKSACSCDKSSDASTATADRTISLNPNLVVIDKSDNHTNIFNTTMMEDVKQFEKHLITQSFHTFEANFTLDLSNFELQLEERVNKTLRKYVTIAAEKTNKTLSALTIRTTDSKKNCTNSTTGAIYLDSKYNQLIVCNGINFKMLQLHSLPQGDSCLQLFNDGFSSSGVYTLRQKDGRKPYKTFCDMNGGWTLIMKINGAHRTFHYSSHLWTSDHTTYNEDAVELYDQSEAKLASYWALPFTELMLGMKQPHTSIEWVTIPYTANSLYSILADGQYRGFNRSVGKKKWMSMLQGSSLQRYCNREGFNVLSSGSKYGVRIGMISNNEFSCASADSRIGFGGRGTACGPSGAESNSCGNVAPLARCLPSNGPANIRAFGYILAR